jgi:nucleotide-binding universal stress UspA family protein
MTFQHILFPTDFSTQSDSIVPSVIEMVRRFRSRLTLLNVLETPAPSPAMDGSVVEGLPDLREFERQYQQRLESFRLTNFPSTIATAVLRTGDPAHAIGEYAKASGVDLIMMPTHGYGRFRAALLGSVTAKVIHDTPCPVWTSVHSEMLHNPPYPCRLILCAVDDVDQSAGTIKRAGLLAHKMESSLMLVHAVSQERTRSEAEIRSKLQALESSADVSVPIHIATGQIEAVVTHTAKDHCADLIVIGRGHSPEKFGTLRSHVYSIIRESSCPVLTI